MAVERLSRNETKLLRSLRQRSHREAEGMFITEGVRVVEELLRSRIVLRTAVISSGLEDTPRGRAIVVELEARARVFHATEAELQQIAETDQPQGVVVAAVTPRPALPPVPPRIAVVVDGIQDPGNFGAIARSALAFGAELMIALPGSVDAWNGKTLRASAGTLFHLPVVPMDVIALAAWCRQNSIELWGAAADGESIRSVKPPQHVALVLGNEGAGMRNETRAILDRTVSLEMNARVESLNAGVAAGILLYMLGAARNNG